MDLNEFGKLKPLHLIAFCFCVMCASAVGAYGIYAFTSPINTFETQKCVCKQSEVKDDGPIDSKKTEQFVSPSGDILCGPPRTK